MSIFGGNKGPQKPVTYHQNLSVFGVDHGVPLNATLFVDGGATIAGVQAPEGRFQFSIPVPPAHKGDGCEVRVNADGYVSQAFRVPVNDGDTTITMERTAVQLPALVVRGSYFALETGERFTAIECSDFQAFSRFLNGEDITPVLTERRALGFNMLRVFGMCRNMFDLNPHAYPDYYETLREFVARVLRSGLYVEFTVFPDCALVMPDIVDQMAHWDRVCTVLRPFAWGCLVELQNEADQKPNRIDASAFRQPSDLIASHGSNGSQALPVRPWWSYETFHVNDAPEWWRKCSHNGMELSVGTEGLIGSHVPVLANEKTRPDRDRTVAHYEDAARACALLIAGSCFHSESGKYSVLFTDADRPFAQAFVAGATSMPLDCQNGPYVHRLDLEGPTDLRTYQRGNTDQCVARIRK